MPDGYEDITAAQLFPMRAPERAQDLPVNSGRLISLVAALADSGCICLNGLNARVGILRSGNRWVVRLSVALPDADLRNICFP